MQRPFAAAVSLLLFAAFAAPLCAGQRLASAPDEANPVGGNPGASLSNAAPSYVPIAIQPLSAAMLAPPAALGAPAALASAARPLLPTPAASPLGQPAVSEPSRSMAEPSDRRAAPARGERASGKGRTPDLDAGEKAGADGDVIFDGGRKALHPGESDALLVLGYRFDDQGRLLAPATGKPLTITDIRGIRYSWQGAANRETLLRLSNAKTARDKNALVKAGREGLPREVVLAVGTPNEQPVVLRRLSSLYRRWLARDPFENPKKIEPVAAADEERLGALVSDAVLKRFSADPEGQKLLDELKDGNEGPRLPAIRVLDLDMPVDAIYSSYGQQVIINLAALRDRIRPHIPFGERDEAEKSLAAEAGSLEYLSRRPELVVEAMDDVIFHELVHFKQDLKGHVSQAHSRGEILGLSIEHEYEAHLRQSLYIHSRVLSGASLKMSGISYYLTLIANPTGAEWKRRIETDYRKFPDIADLDELESLQTKSSGLIRILASGDERPSAKHKVAGAARGVEAIVKERPEINAEFEKLFARRPQIKDWAALEKTGRWPQLAALYDALARRMAPKSQEARDRARKWEEKALIRLSRGDRMSLRERLDWISSLAELAKGRGGWSQELCAAVFRDYPLWAERLLQEVGRSSDAKENEIRLADVRDYMESADYAFKTLSRPADHRFSRDELERWIRINEEIGKEPPRRAYTVDVEGPVIRFAEAVRRFLLSRTNGSGADPQHSASR